MKRKCLIIFLLFAPFLVYSQQIINPNFALASHPMKVERISYTPDFSVISLSIENQSSTGEFCANKNIYLQDVISKKKESLIKTTGIPVCPQSYKFKYVGEVLVFQLYFQNTKQNSKYLTLIEDCNQHCFSIKGIILDKSVNAEIDNGYDYYKKGKHDLALESFKKTINLTKDYPFGIYHLNILQIYAEMDDFINAKTWYKKIVNSSFYDKDELIDRIKSLSYYNKL